MKRQAFIIIIHSDSTPSHPSFVLLLYAHSFTVQFCINMVNSDGETDKVGTSRQSTSQQQEIPQHAEVAAGSAYPKIPLPTMIDGNIEAYFMSLDFWFTASGVVDDNRKYNTVMAQVPPLKLMELRSIIDALPNLNRYLYIKQQLTAHFADSQQRRLHRVLSDMPLGDNKPSKLFYDMTRTANGALSDAVLMDLWAARLPGHAQAAVVASQGTTADRVRIADAVTESLNMRSVNQIDSVPNINAAQSSSGSVCQCMNLADLRNEIAEILKGQNIRSRSNQRSRPRSRDVSRGRSNSRRRDSSIEEFDHCWYHRTHGSKAKSCRQPCSYRKPNITQQ